MEKGREGLRQLEIRLGSICGKTAPVFRACFQIEISTEVFSFSTGDVEKLAHRLELMLVFISLTVSAKAGSFFIFFSTCWME